MPPAFLQVAVPVLYVYDEGVLPEAPPGFDMGLLPVISRALKEHANTPKVTVITGAPTAAEDLPRGYTNLALQYATIKKATPEAGNLLVAEFVADHFDAESVLKHLERIVDERQRELAESVDDVLRRTQGVRSLGDDATDADVRPGHETPPPESDDADAVPDDGAHEAADDAAEPTEDEKE